jgi:DNA adenine methylase
MTITHVPERLGGRRRSVARGGVSLMRYPGGKSKLLGEVTGRLGRLCRRLGPDAEYREPFFGAGAVGLAFLGRNTPVRSAWINDRDPAMAALWHSVIHEGDSLAVLVEMFPEAVRLLERCDYFRTYRGRLREITDTSHLRRYPPAVVGLMKILAHQMSFSGLGTCAGGRTSDSMRRCRPENLVHKITSCGEALGSVRLREGTCTSLDFDRLFEPGEALFYLDPPYYQAGPALYQFSFAPSDHERLARILRRESRPWLLSYDDHPAVHELYRGWSRIERVNVGYSINGHTRKDELLISNHT